MRTKKLFYITLVFLGVLALGVYYDSHRHAQTIKIAAGIEGGAYYQYAEQYRDFLAEAGVNLVIEETEGSIEAQKKLLNREVDFAFIQSGTEDKRISVLANIEYEPVWIFHRDPHLTSLKKLQNQKIAIGNDQSGTLPIAQELLTVSNIDNQNNELLQLPAKEALQGFREKKIDMLFYVASYRARVVSELIARSDVYLLDFPRAEAYRQYFLKEGEDYEVLKLEAHGFDLAHKIPKQDYALLTKTTMLATRDDVSNRMSRLLLQVSEKVHGKADMFRGQNVFPNDKILGMKQHEASIDYFKQKVSYLERQVSYWYAQTLTDLYSYALIFLVPIITVFAFVVEVIIPAYSHISRKRINRWYDMVNAIDTGLNRLSLEEMKEKKYMLENLLLEIRATDDIPAVHMEAFYTLQNQIVSIIANLERRIGEN